MRHEAFHDGTKRAQRPRPGKHRRAIAHHKGRNALSIDMLRLRAPHTFIQGRHGGGQDVGRMRRKVASAVD